MDKTTEINRLTTLIKLLNEKNDILLKHYNNNIEDIKQYENLIYKLTRHELSCSTCHKNHFKMNIKKINEHFNICEDCFNNSLKKRAL